MTVSKQSSGFEYKNKKNESPFETFLRYTNQKEMSAKQLSNVLQALGSESNILDLGAGNGEYLSLALSRMENVEDIRLTLVEPSTDLVRQLKGRFDVILPGANVTIAPSDLDNFSSNEKFDAIIAAHLFYHIPRSSWPQQLEKMLSLLKPQGRLIIVLRDKDDAYMFKMKFKPLLSDKSFSAMTIDDVVSALPNINKLRITRHVSESELKIPIDSNPEDTESIVEFYLNKQWPDIPVVIQQAALGFIRSKHGLIQQLDCIAVIEKIESK
ncbi:MAG TPA: class I SAM-dependent methyltransferase [Verrucomicrobiae bacterium]|nr:class I SAM-dependent methyltransferase [Verrucomicrobiae bacterium]